MNNDDDNDDNENIKKAKDVRFFQLLNNLPYELTCIIKEYAQPITFAVINKNIYINTHFLFEEIAKTKFESYTRYIIRRDLDFPFSIILEKYFPKWLLFKNYEYKHMVFSNYLYFLQYYCIENDSSKCRIKLNILFNETGLSKNQHKKNIIKYIKI